MKLKAANTSRRNFITLFTWMQSQIPYEKIEDEALEVYASAMEWYEKNLGNAKYVELGDDDVKLMLAFQHEYRSTIEASNITGLSTQQIGLLLDKLMKRGLVVYQTDRRNEHQLYKLSYHGNKILLREIHGGE